MHIQKYNINTFFYINLKFKNMLKVLTNFYKF